jgi:hypothetical protein
MGYVNHCAVVDLCYQHAVLSRVKHPLFIVHQTTLLRHVGIDRIPEIHWLESERH